MQYRFRYEENPINPALGFSDGPNDPANRAFYRIREAYVGRLEGETFTPIFRALQGGEIGFAFREQGAGDFVGGFHGDEVMTFAELIIDGQKTALNQPRFATFTQLTFLQESIMTRCNTPDEKLVLHKQKYTVFENTVQLFQHIEWLSDAKPLHAAYAPMLTAQRLDPKDPSRVLTDTVEFYDGKGALLTTFDTTPYGPDAGGKYCDTVCKNTPAWSVKVYGKESGLALECGFTVVAGSIPIDQLSADLCIRYGKALDNKIYFEIGGKTAPKAGTVWEKDVYYRLTYQ